MKNKRTFLLTAVLSAVVIIGLLCCNVSCTGKIRQGLPDVNLTLLAEQRQTDTSITVNDTLLLFDSSVANLGKVRTGEKKEVEFLFTNVSGSPVVITTIETTCGCTSPRWNKQPVMPDTESWINVSFEAGDKGVFFKKLYVHCAGFDNALQIAIKGEVY